MTDLSGPLYFLTVVGRVLLAAAWIPALIPMKWCEAN